MAKKLHGKQIKDSTILQAHLSLTTPINSGDAATKIYVDSLLTGSTTGVTSLSTAISTEISTRGSADTSLSTAISSEISNRISGDSSLETIVSGLTAEETVSRTIYISTAGSDTTGDGSSGNTYATYLKAIKSIRPIINSGVTITIDVAAGTYTVDMIETDKYTKRMYLGRNAGITVSGKYVTDVSGLTITASSTPYIYNVTGSTFTVNQYQDYFMYNGTTAFPIAYNSATTINSVVGATSCTSIIHNTTTFNIANGNFTLNIASPYVQNLIFNNIDITNPSGAIRFINNGILDFQNSKITATQGSIVQSSYRNNFTNCAFVLSSSSFTPANTKVQFRNTTIRKSGTKTGIAMSLSAQGFYIPPTSAFGLYLYNWATGIECFQGNFEFNQANSSVVFDNCTTAITIRNNSYVTFTPSSVIYLNNVTTFLGVGTETLYGNYKVLVQSITGVPTTYVASAILSNGLFDSAKNISIYINGYNSNTILSNTSDITVSGVTGFSGLTYITDFSNNYTNRSLVDKGFVTGYTSGMTSANTSLSTAISSEISIRESADTSLSSAISSEISTRSSADTSLSTAISVVSGGTPITNYGLNRILTSDGTANGINANTGMTFNSTTNTLSFNNSIVSLSGSSKIKFYDTPDSRSIQALQSYYNFDVENYGALLIGPFISLFGDDTPRTANHGDSIMMRAENTTGDGGWINIIAGGGNSIGGAAVFRAGDGVLSGGTTIISGGVSDNSGGDLILEGGLSRVGGVIAGNVKINSGSYVDSIPGATYIEDKQLGSVYIYTTVDSGAKISIGDIMRYSATGLSFTNTNDIVNKYYIDSLVSASGGTVISNYGDDRLLTSDGTQKGMVAESNLTFDGSQMLLNGNLNILGNLYVSGTTVTINTQNMQVSDNLILINSGETGSGVTSIIAGIEVERGSLTNYQFIFNETYDTFRVGEIGSLQAVATREDSPISSGITFWNNDTKQIYTSSNLTFVNSRLNVNGSLAVTGNTYISGLPSSSQSNVLFYNTSTGQITYGTASTGSVTSISAGNGMNFSTITSSGSVTLGTPSDINTGSTNSVSTNSHTHIFNSASYITGSDGILINGNGQFIIDNNYITNSTLANLYSYTGVTSNRDLGILVSGQTLGMVYITNTGTTTAEVNLGTTVTGNEITPYKTISVTSGETVSVTVNMRLSNTVNTTIYINSATWTNVNLTVQWANITYKNASTTISPGDLPMASAVSLGAIMVGTGLSINGSGVLSTNLNLDGLSDVTITTPSSTQILTYNGSQWVNSGISISTNLDSLTDVTLSSLSGGQYLVYNGSQWVNSGLTGAGGGFLGNITKNSSVPSGLADSQWYRPEPQNDGTFNYTFDNFYDSGSIAINVNLSLEDVFLRYNKTGNYWVKESYNRPLTSGKTWIGSTNNIVQEIDVVDEWVSTESGITYIGQKYAYPTHTVFKTDFDVFTTLQNFIFVQNINLKSIGNTAILTIPTGKRVLFNRFKLIILNDASPTAFTISVGNNNSSYNNLSPSLVINDVLTNETYELEVTQNAVTQSSGSVVYFRVSSASTNVNPLSAHLLVEGYIF
jgi:hypothetical protein